MKLIAFIMTTLLLAPAAASAPTATHAEKQRVNYLSDALSALRGAPQSTLSDVYQYIYVVHRSRCKAPSETLQVGCLIEAARKNCRQRGDSKWRCDLMSDVIATNLLSETRFVTRSERLEIMQNSKSYKRALSRELRRRYASLVTEMAMTTRGRSRGLPHAIDAYCRDVAGTRDLSWQHCAAAIVWFVATEGRDI